MGGTVKPATAASKNARNKKTFAFIVVAVFILAALGAALLLSQNVAAEPKIFRYGTISGPSTLDPAVCYDTFGGEILQNVYETLVFYNESSSYELKPMLAAEMPEISENGLTYTFILREGVKFSNGVEMTAEDVKYSFDRGLILNDPSGPFWMYGAVLIPNYHGTPEANRMDAYGMAQFDSAGKIIENDRTITQEMCDAAIWAKDVYEVQFNLTRPYAAFLNSLAFNAGSIVSKDYVEEHGGMTKAGYVHMTTHAMGTGPYVLEALEVDDYIKLVANKDYWREPPSIEVVMIQIVPDVNARIMALRAGDLDAAYIPRVNLASVDGHENLTIIRGGQSLTIEFLGLNQKINTTGAGPAVTNVPSDFFTDRNVRLAFAHAFNYTNYIQNAMQGMAIQPNGAIPPGMLGYNADVPVYDHNLTKAAEYLAATESDTPGQSWLDKGFKLEVFYNSGNFARESACMQLKNDLAALSNGRIEIKVTGVAVSEYWALWGSGKMPALFLAWAPDYADPDNYLQPLYTSGGTWAPVINYANETLDAAIMAAAAELDEDARAQMYEELMVNLYEECVFIWTIQSTSFFVCQDHVEGYRYNPMLANLYYYDLDVNRSA